MWSRAPPSFVVFKFFLKFIFKAERGETVSNTGTELTDDEATI